MSPLKIEKLEFDRLRSVAAEMQLRLGEDLLESAKLVALALRRLFPRAPVFECSTCGFPAPKVEAIAECPGCGEAFEEESEDEEADFVHAPDFALVRQVEPEVILPFEGGIEAAKDLLESKTARICSLRADLAVNGWEIGVELQSVVGHELWRALHQSFAEYVETRLGFSAQTARDFMAVAKAFRREELSGLSITSLRLLAKVPEGAARDALIERARSGTKTRELAQEAKSSRAAAGLATERRGLKGVLVNFRAEAGPVAEGELRGRGRLRRAKLELGGHTFELEVDRRSAAFRLVLSTP